MTYKCPHCGKEFVKLYSFIDHVEEHTEFERTSEFNKMKSIKDKCPQCSKKLSSYYVYRRHCNSCEGNVYQKIINLLPSLDREQIKTLYEYLGKFNDNDKNNSIQQFNNLSDNTLKEMSSLIIGNNNNTFINNISINLNIMQDNFETKDNENFENSQNELNNNGIRRVKLKRSDL